LGKKIIAKYYFFSVNNFTFPADNFTFPADNFTFPADPKILVLPHLGTQIHGKICRKFAGKSAEKTKNSSND